MWEDTQVKICQLVEKITAATMLCGDNCIYLTVRVFTQQCEKCVANVLTDTLTDGSVQ